MSAGRERIASAHDAAPAPEPVEASPLAILWRDFLAAVRGLTIVRPGSAPAPARIGRESLFYPLVGLLVGAALWLLDTALRLVLSQELTSVLLVTALAVLSGGRHLDGFGNTADGLIGVRGREDALAAMHERPLGTFGTAAIFFLLIAKVRCFDLLAEDARILALFLAPMVGRWAMVVLAHGARDAGADEGTKFARDVGSREFAGASVLALALVLSAAEAIGLVVIVASAAATVGLRVWFHHRLGGITTQNLGAVAETVETLALVLFAFVS